MRSLAKPAPILVTGIPRSGTTWLARLLAQADGTALAGREPMNPERRGYALAGTLDGWARVTTPTRRQRRAITLAYRGLTPFAYGRQGHRQWAAPLPRVRLVVRDPFALLSVPAIARLTGAVPVLVYRHPAAQLASYRRMGWQPDTDELQAIVEESRRTGGPHLPDLPATGTVSEAEEMGYFWRTLHQFALAEHESAAAPYDLVVVSHGEFASGGPEAGRRLATRLGLTWAQDMEREFTKESSSSGATNRLHNLDRAPSQVAEAWRADVRPDEVAAIEAVTADTLGALEERCLSA